MKIEYKKAELKDLKEIIALLFDDDLGKNREFLNDEKFQNYKKAFLEIEQDKKQFLLIGKINDEIISTCHLTIMPSLTFSGSRRLNIEAVRVKKNYRKLGLGEDLLKFADNFAQENNCKIMQLAMNKERKETINFYQKQGFESTHEGMKKYL